jgi:outer membrane protein assembly factor BamE
MNHHILSRFNMPVFSLRGLRWLLWTGSLAGLSLCLSACGSYGTDLSKSTAELADRLTPYKVEVVQGNFVSKEQVQAIQPGMSRQQVREILGTSLLVSAFHSNRWDYVFTIQRQGVEAISRRLTVVFDGDVVDHVEGDEMPSEVDFVSRLDPRRKPPEPPPLKASDEALDKFPLPKPAAEEGVNPVMLNNYPPLEPTAR